MQDHWVAGSLSCRLVRSSICRVARPLACRVRGLPSRRVANSQYHIVQWLQGHRVPWSLGPRALGTQVHRLAGLLQGIWATRDVGGTAGIGSARDAADVGEGWGYWGTGAWINALPAQRRPDGRRNSPASGPPPPVTRHPVHAMLQRATQDVPCHVRIALVAIAPQRTPVPMPSASSPLLAHDPGCSLSLPLMLTAAAVVAIGTVCGPDPLRVRPQNHAHRPQPTSCPGGRSGALPSFSGRVWGTTSGAQRPPTCSPTAPQRLPTHSGLFVSQKARHQPQPHSCPLVTDPTLPPGTPFSHSCARLICEFKVVDLVEITHLAELIHVFFARRAPLLLELHE